MQTVKCPSRGGQSNHKAGHLNEVGGREEPMLKASNTRNKQGFEECRPKVPQFLRTAVLDVP